MKKSRERPGGRKLLSNGSTNVKKAVKGQDSVGKKDEKDETFIREDCRKREPGQELVLDIHPTNFQEGTGGEVKGKLGVGNRVRWVVP